MASHSAGVLSAGSSASRRRPWRESWTGPAPDEGGRHKSRLARARSGGCWRVASSVPAWQLRGGRLGMVPRGALGTTIGRMRNPHRRLRKMILAFPLESRAAMLRVLAAKPVYRAEAIRRLYADPESREMAEL